MTRDPAVDERRRIVHARILARMEADRAARIASRPWEEDEDCAEDHETIAGYCSRAHVCMGCGDPMGIMLAPGVTTYDCRGCGGYWSESINPARRDAGLLGSGGLGAEWFDGWNDTYRCVYKPEIGRIYDDYRLGHEAFESAPPEERYPNNGRMWMHRRHAGVKEP